MAAAGEHGHPPADETCWRTVFAWAAVARSQQRAITVSVNTGCISVVVPCFNEEQVLPQLFERIQAAACSWGASYEVVVVDDGSHDGSWSLIESFHRQDARWKAIRFSRNFGHQIAVSAGLAHAVGEAVIVIDADLQDPPEVIVELIDHWREGYDVVYAVRTQRKEGLAKRLAYGMFYRVLSRLANIDVPLDAGDFCLMDRRVVQLIVSMPEQNRFIRGLRAWSGFRQRGVSYERGARASGASKYSLPRLLQLAIDGILSFSIAPLRVATYLGLVVSTLAFAGALFTLVQRLFAEQFARIGLGPVPGFATIVISVLFLGGVQLVCLGIIGEYLGRVYDEVKRRPLWIIDESLGVEPKACS